MDHSIHFIPLDKILPEFQAKVSTTYIDRMKKATNLTTYDILLAVEKDQQEDFYRLVGGYDRYHYLRNFSNEINAPCVIEESRQNNNRWLLILLRFNNKGDTDKENKQTVISILTNIQQSINSIIKATGFSGTYFRNNYEYNTNIPENYINENTTEKTMNWIQSLKIDQEVKKFLYERAGFPKGDSNRLTNDAIKIISELLKLQYRFNELPIPQQIRIIKMAINFKGMVLSLLIEMVDDLLKKHRKGA